MDSISTKEDSTMHRRLLLAASLVVAACTILITPVAQACPGGIYQLDMRWEGALPASYPVTIEFLSYDGTSADPTKLKGTSSVDWDGVSVTNWLCDDFACITAVREEGGKLVVEMVASGWNSGKFRTETAWEVVVGGERSFFHKHTSCSQPILLEVPQAGTPAGTFFFTGGFGSCFAGADCPMGDKAYCLTGEFHISLASCTPGPITLNLYEKDSNLKGTSTATWTGTDLINIVCDDLACIQSASVQGGELVIVFEASGWGKKGEFATETSFEFDLGACGVHKLTKLHTSCSQPIFLDYPYPAGSGNIILTGGCGACYQHSPTPTWQGSWGMVKVRYR
ncbi:MAG: hypothetical protein A2V63_08645 [Candidatus Eisenbacteria bacterium RBG_19FT_COMBO_70_11]|nr:MAG: hypothetical protein A2V63_08645 [Candidatus Eisenbacteria bacterium RBG_19FT_COMBO_70_11]